MGQPEIITWTRVLLNGALVGCLDPSVDVSIADPATRPLYRSLYAAGYRFAKRGHWERSGAERDLVFDCGNSLGCYDVSCNHHH